MRIPLLKKVKKRKLFRPPAARSFEGVPICNYYLLLCCLLGSEFFWVYYGQASSKLWNGIVNFNCRNREIEL